MDVVYYLDAAPVLVHAAEGSGGTDWATLGVGIAGALATLASAFITARYQTAKRDRVRRSKIKGNELSIGGISEDSSFSALDVLKVIDLRDSPTCDPAIPGSAVLSDSHLITREAETGSGVIFCYATSGDFAGVQSTRVHKWGELQPHTPLKTGATAKCYGLGIDLQNLAVGDVVRVTNEVVYRGGFDDAVAEAFETHVDRTTASLTFVLLFSERHRCTRVVGEQDLMRDQWQPVDKNRPEILQEGRCVYWRVFRDDTDLGLPHRAKYRLRWEWQPTASAAAPRSAQADAVTTAVGR